MTTKFSLRKAVELAITAEQEGTKFYDTLAESFSDDAELREMFTVLARDEEIHEHQFRALLRDLPADEPREIPEREQVYIQALAEAEFFSPLEDAAASAAKISSRQDGLQRAYSLERKALLFYSGLREILGPSDVLDAIIATEKQHLTRVMKYMFSGAEMRGLLEDY